MKKNRIIIVFFCAFCFALFLSSAAIAKAQTVSEQVKQEFSERSMPDGFTVIGTGFVHYDSVEVPDKLFPQTIGPSHPKFTSAKGLCGGKYDKYTYSGTAKYVRNLLLQAGYSPNLARDEYFISESEGEFLLFVQGQYPVVDYDETAKKYIVWCKGEWNSEIETPNCTKMGYNMSHRPGFYAVDKKYLYVDDVFQHQAVPGKIGTGNIMKPYLLLYKQPSTSSDIYWWANQLVNSQIDIVGEEGDFYKVSFQHSQFLKKRRVCFVQKKYVNAELQGTAKPESVYQAKTSTMVNIRADASLSSEILGVAYKGTRFDVIEKGNEFNAVVFNGKKAYIASKYLCDFVLKDSYKCQIKLSGKIKIKKISKKSITFAWKRASKADGYKVLYSNGIKKEQCLASGNSIKIPLSVINKNARVFSIWVYPAQKLPDGIYSTGRDCIKRSILVPSAKRYSVKRKGKTMIFTYFISRWGTQMQYSTRKNFKSAKSLWQKTARKGKKVSKKVTGLKAKKKYYIRARGYIQYKVGKKTYRHYGRWCNMKRV